MKGVSIVMDIINKLFITVFYPEDSIPTGFTEVTKPENFSVDEKIENIKNFLGKTELDIRSFDDKGFTLIILSGEDFVNIINNSTTICNNFFQPWHMFPSKINLAK
ncbi:MAG: hypothetical protein PHS06_02225 [Candidatus Shapirobacteria bacterium]|nr:hypothetical protein [Candidatus Shapirobacteria bacterium]